MQVCKELLAAGLAVCTPAPQRMGCLRTKRPHSPRNAAKNAISAHQTAPITSECGQKRDIRAAIGLTNLGMRLKLRCPSIKWPQLPRNGPNHLGMTRIISERPESPRNVVKNPTHLGMRAAAPQVLASKPLSADLAAAESLAPYVDTGAAGPGQGQVPTLPRPSPVASPPPT